MQCLELRKEKRGRAAQKRRQGLDQGSNLWEAISYITHIVSYKSVRTRGHPQKISWDDFLKSISIFCPRQEREIDRALFYSEPCRLVDRIRQQARLAERVTYGSKYLNTSLDRLGPLEKSKEGYSKRRKQKREHESSDEKHIWRRKESGKQDEMGEGAEVKEKLQELMKKKRIFLFSSLQALLNLAQDRQGLAFVSQVPFFTYILPALVLGIATSNMNRRYADYMDLAYERGSSFLKNTLGS